MGIGKWIMVKKLTFGAIGLLPFVLCLSPVEIGVLIGIG
jgi:hypothetical protein